MPCSDCGASVERSEQEEHECERERWLDYQLFLQRGAIDRFEDDLRDYLAEREGE
jgi:hypothetical protein